MMHAKLFLYAKVSTKNQKDDLKNKQHFYGSFAMQRGGVDQCMKNMEVVLITTARNGMNYWMR